MNKKIIRTKLLIIFSILFFILISSSSITAVSSGGTLKIREIKKPLTFNPLHAADNFSKKIIKQIFERLIIINNKGEVEPYLAESWEIKDEGRTIIVNLRDDVYFHEKIRNDIKTKNGGRKVTAEDWEWSLNYLAAPENKSAYADLLENVEGFDEYREGNSEQIKGIKVLDESTLEFHLEKSNALFLYNLADPAAVVMPKEDVKNKDLNWDLNPVGTGAFIFADLDRKSLSLVKNHNYWDYREDKKLPFLERIKFDFTNINQDNDYSIQEYSLYKITSAEFYSFIEKRDSPENYDLKRFPDPDIYYYGLYFRGDNSYNQGVDNKELRILLNHIIDREELIEKLNSVNYMPIQTNQNIFRYKKNEDTEMIDDLRNKLENTDSLNLKLVINDNDLNIKTAEEIQKQLLNYGIELEVKKLNWVNYLDEVDSNNSKYDLFFMSYKTDNIFDFLKTNFYSETGEENDNYLNYHNSRFNYLLEYLELETESDKRNRALEIIKDIINSDLPALYLMQGAETYFVDKSIKYLNDFNNYNNQFYKYIYLEE